MQVEFGFGFGLVGTLIVGKSDSEDGGWMWDSRNKSNNPHRDEQFEWKWTRTFIPSEKTIKTGANAKIPKMILKKRQSPKKLNSLSEFESDLT